MHILQGSPVPVPQFASLSFLVRQQSSYYNSVEHSAAGIGMGEPMVAASPSATISGKDSLAALRELHSHLTSVQRASSTAAAGKIPPPDRLGAELLREDDNDGQLPDNHLQVFRPLCADGISLHYRLLRGDDKLLLSLSSHIMSSTKGAKAAGASNNSSAVPAGLVGIVFCVAVSGVPSAYRSSDLLYSLPQRVNDCMVLLTKIQDTPSAKVVLSTFLLADDELRKTDDMAQAPDVVVFPDTDEADKAKGILSPMGMMTPMAGLGSPLAGGLGKVSKRLSSRPGKGGGLDDDGGAGSESQMGTGVTVPLRLNSAAAALEMTEKLNILSVAESDTCLRKYARSGQERKANLDLTGGGKSRFRRRKGETRDADLDNFDYKGPSKGIQKRTAQTVDDARIRALNGGKSQLRQPKKDTKSKTPTLRKNSTSSGAGEDNFGPFSGQQLQRHRSSASSHRRRNGAAAGHGYDDDVSLISDGRSAAQSSVGSHSRMQVNIALNEDLSCSYKLSQLSSCSVEGVVQIQVKASSRTPGPFFLYVRDPTGHVDAMQENKKFAEEVTASMPVEVEADHMYAVSIPKGDNYYPVLRYKCGGDLRPVPIRVQTRVKVDDYVSRVALQISSNPNNEASLTDLTIIMGIPDDVNGESLTTQPPGGVWNESKRSVIWCVSELGSGEKFQLQARFDMEDTYNPNGEKPKFPVLVRCQCLFAQLSDVELGVGDIPNRYPADVSMKLAKRFRLSHRERS